MNNNTLRNEYETHLQYVEQKCSDLQDQLDEAAQKLTSGRRHVHGLERDSRAREAYVETLHKDLDRLAKDTETQQRQMKRLEGRVTTLTEDALSKDQEIRDASEHVQEMRSVAKTKAKHFDALVKKNEKLIHQMQNNVAQRTYEQSMLMRGSSTRPIRETRPRTQFANPKSLVGSTAISASDDQEDATNERSLEQEMDGASVKMSALHQQQQQQQQQQHQAVGRRTADGLPHEDSASRYRFLSGELSGIERRAASSTRLLMSQFQWKEERKWSWS